MPGRGFEPRSPRLRRGAFTRLAYQAFLVRMPVIETGPDEWRSSARPSSYTRGNSLLSRLRGKEGWWEVDGIEPLAKKGCVYSAATALVVRF